MAWINLVVKELKAQILLTLLLNPVEVMSECKGVVDAGEKPTFILWKGDIISVSELVLVERFWSSALDGIEAGWKGKKEKKKASIKCNCYDKANTFGDTLALYSVGHTK